MRQIRVIYLEDFDEAAGLAIFQDGKYRFLAARRSFKPLEGRLHDDLNTLADAAYRLVADAAAP